MDTQFDGIKYYKGYSCNDKALENAKQILSDINTKNEKININEAIIIYNYHRILSEGNKQTRQVLECEKVSKQLIKLIIGKTNKTSLIV